MRSAIVTVPARSSARSSATKRLVGVVLLLALAASDTPRVSAQAGEGQWTTLPYLMPINPVHLTLLNNGRVLVVAGSGNVAAETNFRSTIWDPQAGTFSTRSHAWDMFCNGAVVLPDGRVLINGGNKQYDPFRGYQKNALYDPATDTFTDVENMAHGRWYPTPTVLGDGRVMTFSGLDELTGATNKKVEIYTVGSGWSPEYDASWTPPLYPRMHLISDGRVFYSGSGRGSRFFDPSTQTWSSATVRATTKFSGTRGYGTSVLLPLSPSNGYASRVMIFGGGNPATSTTEIIDLSAATPEWQFGPSMSQGRIQLNATILPNGKVLVMGGSVNDEQAATASLNADLYDPKTNTFSSAGANVYPRLYHSGSLLLPDGTVALMGGNPTRGSYEQHIEIYSPAYLFEDGKPALRPTITVRPTRCITATGCRCRRLTPVRSNPSSSSDQARRRMPSIWTSGSSSCRSPGFGFADCDRAASRQHRAAGLLHALHPQLGRGAIAGSLRPIGDRHPREPGAHRDHRQPVIEHDHRSRRIDLVRRLRLRSRRERGVVRLDLRRRQSGREHRGSTRSRDLLHAWQLFGVAHRDRRRRRRQRCRHANDHGRRLLPLGHACVPQRSAGCGYDVHRHRGADRWLHRQRQLRRTRPPRLAPVHPSHPARCRALARRRSRCRRALLHRSVLTRSPSTARAARSRGARPSRSLWLPRTRRPARPSPARRRT